MLIKSALQSLRFWALAISFFLLGAIVFYSQAYDVGFSGWRGWVTSHGLSIAQHAYWENGFVGFAIQSMTTDGGVKYEYFDRYPVFFSVLLNLVMKTQGEDLAARIFFARQFMNFIFLLTVIISFLLLYRLLGCIKLALSSSLLSFSGYFYMFYKDMVHFDQPALLGIIFLIYGIIVAAQSGKRWLFYLAVVVAVSLGRSYSAVAVLALWVAVEGIRLASAHNWKPAVTTIAIARSDALRGFLIGLILTVLYLGHNISREAHLTDVSIWNTSIINSAMRRLPLDEVFPMGERFTWPEHVSSQADRMIRSVTPYFLSNPEQWSKSHAETLNIGLFWTTAALSAAGVLLILFVRAQNDDDQKFWILLVLSGFAWLIPMKNLAVQHEYTTMYHLGFNLVFFAALLSLVPKNWRVLTVPVATAVFVCAILSVSNTHNKTLYKSNIYTTDYQRILRIIPPGSTVFVGDDVKKMANGSPYVASFYLEKVYITPYENADYIIVLENNPSCVQIRECLPLTQDNQEVFMFKIIRSESLLKH